MPHIDFDVLILPLKRGGGLRDRAGLHDSVDEQGQRRKQRAHRQ
jgi:hypothetical protein